MVRVILGAVLAAVVMFMWGFIFWAVLPVSNAVFKRLPDEEAVTAALASHIPQTGVYYFPYWDQADDEATQQAGMEKHARGPIGQVMFVREGVNPMAPATMIIGFIQMLVSTLLAGFMLRAWGPASFMGRVAFVTTLGLFAVVTISVSKVTWFHHPWPTAALDGAYYVAAWLLAGLVLAAFVRRTATPSAVGANGQPMLVRSDAGHRPVGLPRT